MDLSWSDVAIAIMALVLLAIAATSDVARRIIPNWVCLGMALLVVPLVFFSPRSVNLAGHFISFASVFAVTFLLWNRGILGGGDVKLVSALALWCDLSMLGPFLLFVSLAGGLLAVWYVAFSAWAPFAFPVTRQLASAMTRLDGIAPAEEAGHADGPDATGGDADCSRPRLTVPYGVAIAAGGVWVVLQHVPLIG